MTIDDHATELTYDILKYITVDKSSTEWVKSQTKISEEINRDRTTVSRALKRMKRAGLIEEKRTGQSKGYKATPKGIRFRKPLHNCITTLKG